jgi:hypothetical protein
LLGPCSASSLFHPSKTLSVGSTPIEVCPCITSFTTSLKACATDLKKSEKEKEKEKEKKKRKRGEDRYE